ncbi:hypothetical protein [Actibacterium lipolyticum]|nr:hypothetical protein [Actibacterium lipolyticum]
MNEGIHIPGPSKYRGLLRDTMISLRGRTAPAETQELILDTVLDDEKAKRIVFSNQSFFCMPAKIMSRGQFYHSAGEKAQWLSQILPEAECEFHIALRNPATFIPALFARMRNVDFESLMEGFDLNRLLWSDVIQRIMAANPGVKLTVWCNEDSPVIWHDILKALSGHGEGTELVGTDDFLSSIMTETGMARMNTYIASHPPATDAQRRRIIAAFLDKFAIEDEVEVELDLPGWTEQVVDQINNTYDEDVYNIEQMPGVTFLAP